LAFEIPKQPYSGKIGEVTVGSGSSAVKMGGETSYPFYLFEGEMRNPPKIAMEIWDYDPSKEWTPAAVAPFKDVISSPVEWAKKCVKEYGADLIVLQLKSTDPNGLDRSAGEAAKVVKQVSDAVDVPLVVWGTANNQKDEEVLKAVSEACQGKNLALAPVEEGNHKGIGASALGYGHTIVASSPIDVNLAKQLNILLGNLGVQMSKIVIDPTTGGLGYGLEYSYSVMERIRMAALTQEDDKLQTPMVANVGNEVWKAKEAGQSIEDAPTSGDPEKKAILMESTAAVAYLLAGADLIVLRHPESVRFTRSFVQLMVNGGSAGDIQGISKRLEMKESDLLALSPKPNLEFGQADVKEKEKPKKEAPPEKKKEEAKAPAKPEKKVVELKPKAEPKVEKEAVKDTAAEAKAQAEAKAKAEEETKKKAEAQAKAEAEAKAKAEAEAKDRAEKDAKAKAEAEAKAREAAKAKEKEELQALRQKRAAGREQHGVHSSSAGEKTAKKASSLQKDPVQKMIDNLDRIHRRA
jgi:acetyl-CoA decarbonylase/synthase, CODH/ACS complex subunit delta